MRSSSGRDAKLADATRKKLIILELKRPRHTLNVDDINQLKTYVAVAEERKEFGRAEAYLVGSKRSDELARRMKYRSNAFRLLMYSDIIESTRVRYQEFLKTVQPDEALPLPL